MALAVWIGVCVHQWTVELAAAPQCAYVLPYASTCSTSTPLMALCASICMIFHGWIVKCGVRGRQQVIGCFVVPRQRRIPRKYVVYQHFQLFSILYTFTLFVYLLGNFSCQHFVEDGFLYTIPCFRIFSSNVFIIFFFVAFLPIRAYYRDYPHNTHSLLLPRDIVSCHIHTQVFHNDWNLQTSVARLMRLFAFD